MNGIVGFEGFKIPCIIGCCAEERVHPQEISVDLRADVDITPCLESDDIKDTVDYHALHLLCKEIALQGQFHLMETYAHTVLQKVFEKFSVDHVWIKVTKPNPFPNTASAVVELEKRK